jgi:hypothetical protein
MENNDFYRLMWSGFTNPNSIPQKKRVKFIRRTRPNFGKQEQPNTPGARLL